MASLVPGYEYDIFVSCRQKDNKHDCWVMEFVNTASHDHFGLRVKLPNGNVANRVLPVRFHDLNIQDIKLCESITGGLFSIPGSKKGFYRSNE